MLRRRATHDLKWHPCQEQPHQRHHHHPRAVLHGHPNKPQRSTYTTIHLMQSNSGFTQQWALITSGVSALLIMLEGFNVVTASAALVFLVAGLLSCYFLSNKHSIWTARIVFAFEFVFLLGVLTSKTCAKMAGRNVDIAAVKFLLSPASARAGGLW